VQTGKCGTLSTGLTTSGIGRIPEIDEESKWGGRRGDIYVSAVIVNFTSSDNWFIGILMSKQNSEVHWIICGWVHLLLMYNEYLASCILVHLHYIYELTTN
jgi:hypothetical protein